MSKFVAIRVFTNGNRAAVQSFYSLKACLIWINRQPASADFSYTWTEC